MGEPRYRYFIWETDLVLSSSTAGETFVCSVPVDIGDWGGLVVQVDVIDADGGLANGDFQCMLENCMSLGEYEFWQGSGWRDLPGTKGASIDFDPAAFDATLERWMRWEIKHAVAGTHWIRVQIKMFLKKRASPQSPFGRLDEVAREVDIQVRESGYGWTQILSALSDRQEPIQAEQPNSDGKRPADLDPSKFVSFGSDQLMMLPGFLKTILQTGELK